MPLPPTLKGGDAIVNVENVGGKPTYGVVLYDNLGNIVFPTAGSGGTASAFGAAFPASGTPAGFKDSAGVNMQPGNLDAAGNLKVSGSLSTTPPASSTSVLTNAAATGASQTLLSANVNRLAFVLYNDSTGYANVKLGAVASATSFTKRMFPGETWSSASGVGVNYTGRIDAISDSAVGTFRITELSA
jgi:hypothetical protein